VLAGSGTCSSISRQVTWSKLPAGFVGHGLRRDQAIVDRVPALVEMQARDGQGLFRQVDAGDLRSQRGHALAQQAAATADVDHALALELRMCVDPCHAGRIDVVQGTEFGVRIPPAMGDFPELVEFLLVGVGGCVHHDAPLRARLSYGPGGRGDMAKKSPAGQGFFRSQAGLLGADDFDVDATVGLQAIDDLLALRALALIGLGDRLLLALAFGVDAVRHRHPCSPDRP
jgi:hypothetical protein